MYKLSCFIKIVHRKQMVNTRSIRLLPALDGKLLFFFSIKRAHNAQHTFAHAFHIMNANH
jgi:hypothetical protein